MKQVRSGVYKIVNIVNGKVYVGSAKNFYQRWPRHRMELNNGTHHSARLQNSYNKHGVEAFKFEVIEYIKDICKLVKREQYWMDFYKSYDKRYGYNISPTAGSCLGIKRGEQLITKRRKENIIKFCEKNGYKPVHDTKDCHENQLGNALHNFTYKEGSVYDFNFSLKMAKYPTFKEYRKKTLVQKILSFTEKRGYLPSRTSSNVQERKLRIALDRFINISTDSYDPQVEQKIIGIPTKQIFHRNSMKKKLKMFVFEQGYIPNRNSISKNECFLGKLWNQISTQNSPRYDAKLVGVIRKFPTWYRFQENNRRNQRG